MVPRNRILRSICVHRTSGAPDPDGEKKKSSRSIHASGINVARHFSATCGVLPRAYTANVDDFDTMGMYYLQYIRTYQGIIYPGIALFVFVFFASV